MLKTLVWVGVVLVVAVGVVLVYAATLPKDFRVSRAASIKAPREKIFPLISDLKSFNLWNPFAKQDPSMRITYRRTTSDKGAAFDWDSDGRGGTGSLEILDTQAPSSVTMRLDVMKPMEGHNTVVFALQQAGEATEVTWTMTGPYAFIARVIGVVVSMDRMIGGEFEKGLAELKALAER